jgi:fructooligosaccharide transport system substrate-binding protein
MKSILNIIGFFIVVGVMLGCSKPQQHIGSVLRVWCHQGQEAENIAMRDIVDAFNKAYEKEGLLVDISFFPDYQYTEKVSTAAAIGDLPDVLDLDGPTVAQFVQAGLLIPIDSYVSPKIIRDFLPTILKQGTIGDRLYALGAFDSALVIYYDKSMLLKAGVEPPPEGEAWTWKEFIKACQILKKVGIDPIAMHMNETADEWYTYGFSPILWSAGGSLISEDGHQVEGILNSALNIAALQKWQNIFNEDLAAKDPVDPDPFGHGKTAMDWTGHWMARSHQKAKGDQLGVMPLPIMKDKQIAACGSWCWGVSTHSKQPRNAIKWLKWITHAEKGVAPIVQANSAIPSRYSSFKLFPEYEKDPYRLFKALLETKGRPRPRTPYYTSLTQHFAAALRDIAHGADVKKRLDKAAVEIQNYIDRQVKK